MGEGKEEVSHFGKGRMTMRPYKIGGKRSLTRRIDDECTDGGQVVI